MRGTMSPDAASRLLKEVRPPEDAAEPARHLAWVNTCGEAINALRTELRRKREWPGLGMGLLPCAVGNGGKAESRVATMALGWDDRSPLARHPMFCEVQNLARAMNDTAEKLHHRGKRITMVVDEQRILPARFTR